MTFWILMALAGGVTFFSLRYRNLLFSLAASISWLALWRYLQEFPPTNIVVGSFVHDILMYALIIMAIAVMFIWFRTRGKTESVTRISGGEGEILTRSSRQEGVTATRSIMELSPEEYKRYIRSKVRTRRR